MQLSEDDTIFEFLVDEASGRWQHWRERIPAWQYPRGVERPRFGSLVIPTLDSVRYEKLLSLVHSVGKATLVREGGTVTMQFTKTAQLRWARRDQAQCSLPLRPPPCP